MIDLIVSTINLIVLAILWLVVFIVFIIICSFFVTNPIGLATCAIAAIIYSLLSLLTG